MRYLPENRVVIQTPGWLQGHRVRKKEVCFIGAEGPARPALGHSGGGEISQEDGCYGFNCVLPNSHVEALTPSVTVFDDRTFRR